MKQIRLILIYFLSLLILFQPLFACAQNVAHFNHNRRLIVMVPKSVLDGLSSKHKDKTAMYNAYGKSMGLQKKDFMAIVPYKKGQGYSAFFASLGAFVVIDVVLFFILSSLDNENPCWFAGYMFFNFLSFFGFAAWFDAISNNGNKNTAGQSKILSMLNPLSMFKKNNKALPVIPAVHNKTLVVFKNKYPDGFYYDPKQSHCINGTIAAGFDVLPGNKHTGNDVADTIAENAKSIGAILTGDKTKGIECTLGFYRNNNTAGLADKDYFQLHVIQTSSDLNGGQLQAVLIPKGAVRGKALEQQASQLESAVNPKQKKTKPGIAMVELSPA